MAKSANDIKPDLMKPVRTWRRLMLLQSFSDRLVFVLLSLSGLLLAGIWLDCLLLPLLPPPQLILMVYLMGIVVAMGYSWLQRPSLLYAATSLDEAAQTRERISTALELQMKYRQAPDHRWQPAESAVWRDALRRVETLQTEGLFQWRVPRRLNSLLLVLAALGLSALAPRMDLLGLRQAQEHRVLEARQVRQEAARVERLVERIRQEADEQDIKGVNEMTKQVENVLREMQQRPPSRQEALRQLSRLEDQLLEERQKMEPAQQAVRELEKNPLTRTIADEIRKGNMEAAAEHARELQERLEGGEISAEKAQGLQEALTAAANALKSQSPDGATSETSREQIASSTDPRTSQNALSQALQDLEGSLSQLGEQTLTAEQMDKILAQLGDCKQCLGGGASVKRMTTASTATSQSAGRDDSIPLLEEEGSTNLDQPGGPGRSWARGALPPGEYIRLYDPRRTELEAVPIRSQSALGEGQIIGTLEVPSRPGQEEVQTPYRETFSSFRSSAEDALAQEQIPLKYRPMVQRYFDSVDTLADQGESNRGD